MPNWKKVITSGSNGELNTLKLSGVVNANTDTDKFLVLDGTGNVDFRTGTQVLSDIGGQGNSPGTISSSAQISGYNKFLEFTGDGVISSSAQVNHDATTNFVANEHIDHTTVSISAGNGLSGGGTIASTRTLTLNTSSVHFTSGVKKKLNTEGVISSSAQVTISSTTGYTTFSSSIAADIANLGGAGYVDGTGVSQYVAKWTDSNTLTGSQELRINTSNYLAINGHSAAWNLATFAPVAPLTVRNGTDQGSGQPNHGISYFQVPNGRAGYLQFANGTFSTFTGMDTNGDYYIGFGNATDRTFRFVNNGAGGAPSLSLGTLTISGSGTLKNIGPAQFSGSVSITTANQVAATTDTDKFVVLDGQQLKYRTGAQVLSDIGGQASSNAVTTNSTQTISGAKTFSANLKATSNAEFTGSVKLNTQTAATTDTDKFLVFDAGGQIKYRTGAQVLSDIGGQASGNYVDLSSTQTIGGVKTFTSNATFNGNVVVGGTITAQQFNTELVSASIIYQSGSTKFGNTSDDKHDFTGSIRVDGGITIWNLNDPQLTFAGQGLSSNFSMGIDDSDSDKFKISRSSTLGTNDIYKYNYNGGNQNHTFAGDVVLTNSNVGLTGGQLVKINSSGFLVPAVANTDYVPTGSTPNIYVISPVQTYVDFKSLTQGGLPWGGSTDLMPIDRWMGVWIAPSEGYIEKIIISPENSNATTDQLSIQMYNNASTQGSPVSQLMGAPGTNVSYTFGSTNYSFSGGDRIYLDLNKNTNSCDFYAVQVVFRLNN